MTTDKTSGEWMPIESAPKDGSNLLGICASAYSPEASEMWWAGRWMQYSRPEDKWHGGLGHWFPTHWMPLPSPPLSNKDNTDATE